jgi:hypothetical protein
VSQLDRTQLVVDRKNLSVIGRVRRQESRQIGSRQAMPQARLKRAPQRIAIRYETVGNERLQAVRLREGA